MSFQYYFYKTLFFLTPIILITLLYFYGSEYEYFDYINIGALAASSVFCRKDKDVLSALLPLLGYLCLVTLIYLAPDTLILGLLIYSASLAIALYYLPHITAKILLGFLLVSLGAEVYWWIIEYNSKPKMVYQIGLMALTVWLNKLWFNRIFIMSDYFGYSTGKVALDTHLGGIYYCYYILTTLMASEYLIRHLAGKKDLLVIYNLYPVIAMLISALSLGMIYMHYFYYQSKKHLSA